MSKQKYVEINGETFELQKPSDILEWQSVKNSTPRYQDIWAAYGVPSVRKVNKWKAWVEWADEMSCRIWIESRNCNFFTICGFTEWENRRYWLRITHCHNYAWEVEK